MLTSLAPRPLTFPLFLTFNYHHRGENTSWNATENLAYAYSKYIIRNCAVGGFECSKSGDLDLILTYRLNIYYKMYLK